MLAREVNHLSHLRLGDLVRINAAHPDAFSMHMQHDLVRLVLILVEEPFEDMNDKFHRGVVVVQQQNFVHGRFCRLGARPRNNACAGPAIIAGTILAGSRTARRRAGRSVNA